MIESGVIKYGDEFQKSMEEGGWDLSKVDEKELEKSQATLVFGQMNEPPGARARVALSGLTIAEYFRDGAGDGQDQTFARVEKAGSAWRGPLSVFGALTRAAPTMPERIVAGQREAVLRRSL